MRQQIKPIPVDLGFETVNLMYDFNALAEITDILTPAELAALSEDQETRKVSLKTVRAMLWAGCLHERPDATQMEVGRMIDPAKLGDVGLAMAAALASHMPTLKGGSAPKENPTTAIDGSSSGLSVVSTAA